MITPEAACVEDAVHPIGEEIQQDYGDDDLQDINFKLIRRVDFGEERRVKKGRH